MYADTIDIQQENFKFLQNVSFEKFLTSQEKILHESDFLILHNMIFYINIFQEVLFFYLERSFLLWKKYTKLFFTQRQVELWIQNLNNDAQPFRRTILSKWIKMLLISGTAVHVR